MPPQFHWQIECAIPGLCLYAGLGMDRPLAVRQSNYETRMSHKLSMSKGQSETRKMIQRGSGVFCQDDAFSSNQNNYFSSKFFIPLLLWRIERGDYGNVARWSLYTNQNSSISTIAYNVRTSIGFCFSFHHQSLYLSINDASVDMTNNNTYRPRPASLTVDIPRSPFPLRNLIISWESICFVALKIICK